MSNRSENLAKRIEQSAQNLITFVEKLSDTQWASVVPNEARSIGVLVHHIASVMPIETQLTQAVGAGHAIQGVTWPVVHDMNAEHAIAHRHASRAETMALLLQNSAAVAATVRGMSDAQLDSVAAISLHDDAPLTAQYLIENHSIRHAYSHVASMRAAVDAEI